MPGGSARDAALGRPVRLGVAEAAGGDDVAAPAGEHAVAPGEARRVEAGLDRRADNDEVGRIERRWRAAHDELVEPDGWDGQLQRGRAAAVEHELGVAGLEEPPGDAVDLGGRGVDERG